MLPSILIAISPASPESSPEPESGTTEITSSGVPRVHTAEMLQSEAPGSAVQGPGHSFHRNVAGRPCDIGARRQHLSIAGPLQVAMKGLGHRHPADARIAHAFHLRLGRELDFELSGRRHIQVLLQVRFTDPLSEKLIEPLSRIAAKPGQRRVGPYATSRSRQLNPIRRAHHFERYVLYQTGAILYGRPWHASCRVH